jgi:phosphatidylglycerol---prolipoprotein diacylglyceryl transferase
MIPFLHLGPLSVPTFGLMVATGLLVAAYVLQADLNRRGTKADAFLMIGIAGLTGIVGARLYHVLEAPREFIANPWPQLFSRYGFAWFGGLIGGFLALILLARENKILVLEFLDACSPAACVGYAIGRIGCLLSGDGDYGIPTSLPWGMSFPNGVVPTTDRVHPTPLYEFLAWMLIALILWKLGSGAVQKGEPTRGRIFCSYLLMTGVARFLVEIIRINPRSFFGMSNAQAASVSSIVLGLVLFVRLRRKPQQT